MKLNIKLFATLKEKARAGSLTLEFQTEQITVKDLLDQISKQYPDLSGSLKSVLVAVNKDFAFPDDIIRGEDEVALFPPVSGG